jgi:hypothetical protein
MSDATGWASAGRLMVVRHCVHEFALLDMIDRPRADKTGSISATVNLSLDRTHMEY